MNMLHILFLTLLLSVNISAKIDDEDYTEDSVIDMLLNGRSQSGENVTDDPNLTAGIWKCGNCTDLENSTIVYSEENYIEAVDENIDDEVEEKIELVLDGMRCVTVSADNPGVVRRLTGACDGAVTLHLTPRATARRHFVVQVYV